MMNKIWYILLLAFLAACSSPAEQENVQKVISSVQEKYAPDHREALFRVTSEKRGDEVILKGETNLPDAKFELMNTLGDNGVKTVDSIEVLPQKQLGDRNWALINLSVANIRSNPRHSAELATQALLGTPVRVLKKHGGWYYIQTPDNYLGWVDSWGIYRENEAGMNQWRNAKRVIFTADYGLIRTQPDVSSQPVSDVVMGNILVQTGTKGKYAEVSFPDGRKGFLPQSELRNFTEWENNVKPDREGICKLAHLFVGRPYLWGGTSPKAMDCSGFVKTVYFNFGIILARDASLMVRHGKPVTLKNAKPGDLLFFGYHGKNGPRVTHTGLYLGNMNIEHSAGRVRLSSLDSTKSNYFTYAPGYMVGMRDVIDSVDTNGIVSVKNHPWY